MCARPTASLRRGLANGLLYLAVRAAVARQHTMVRITSLNTGVRPAVLKVEGRLSGPWVDVLERMVAGAAQGTERVVLDVSGVTFADAAGVAALRRLTRSDAELRGGSLFLSSLLAGDAQ